MNDNEKNILRGLVVVAWADGTVKEPEQAIIDGLLWAFGADDDEEKDLRAFAAKKKTLKEDIPLAELDRNDRELLLAHAALMTHADGKQTPAEKKTLDSLVEMLDIGEEDAKRILETARDKAAKLAEKLS